MNEEDFVDWLFDYLDEARNHYYSQRTMRLDILEKVNEVLDYYYGDTEDDN